MTTISTSQTADAKAILAELYRLISALDQRVPRLERSGEQQIARDAADLRRRAVHLIEQIEGSASAELRARLMTPDPSGAS